MTVNKRLSESPGVEQTAVLMGGEKNKGLLADIGFHDAQIDAAQPSDLIVAVIAETPEIVQAVLGRIDEALNAVAVATPPSGLHTLKDGLAQKPGANLVVITIPGEHVAREARQALTAGLNVFIFSSNVSLEEELELKQLAGQKGLLVMGPDCGTSLISGVGIGFANVVRRGPIGVVGAAGTGLQEFTSQVHNAGLGISHAIGTGSHDLSEQVGGLTTFAALDALEADPGTKVIAMISKPPSSRTLERLLERIQTSTKPVVGCFLGARVQFKGAEPVFSSASIIDQAVDLALAKAGGRPPALQSLLSAEEQGWLSQEKAAWSPEQKYLRGLFAGGTFCYQTQHILKEAGIATYSNAPLDPRYALADPDASREHTVVDMGDDFYTLGKPHPMSDSTLRRQRLLKEGRDPQVAVLLLDFILGYNAAMDPVGDLLDAVMQARQTAQKRGRHLTVVASICGTDGDPQDLHLQTQMLRKAGVIVFPSNARAAAFCCRLWKDG
jgi:succinyl-CoA synthetase alpha subunit